MTTAGGARVRRHRVQLCGVTVDVRTDHADFSHHLDAQFPPRADDAVDARPADIDVNVRWTEGPRSDFTPGTVFPDWPAGTRVGRYIYTAPGRLLWTRVDDAKQIAIAAERRDGTPHVEVRFHFTLGEARRWRENMKRVLRRRQLPRMRRHRLGTLAYYAVYYPVWWHLEAVRGLHPLHAAGVAVHGRALLLAGMPGSGKSALTVSFLGTEGAELLSDNVILYDNRLVYGCFEPLLLDAETRARLPAIPGLRALGREHPYLHRDAFDAPHRTDGVSPAAAVIVVRGGTTRLEPLEQGECARLLLAGNEAAKEVRRYHVLTSVLGFSEREPLARPVGREAHLQRLLAGVPCYRLQVREGAPAEGVACLRELVAAPRGEVAL